MCSWLTCEVPSPHNTLCSFTFGSSLHIYTLSDLIVQWTEHVSNRQKVLWAHFELASVGLGWHPRFKKFTNFWLLEEVGTILLPVSQHQRIDAIRLHGLLLDDLASIDLDHGDRDVCSPPVPQRGHAHFVSEQPTSF